MEAWFASSKDCDCCQGYIHMCVCCHDESNKHCVECTTPLEAEATSDKKSSKRVLSTAEEAAERETYSASSKKAAFPAKSALTAAAAATEDEEADEVEFGWSVKAFPPQPEELPLDLFESLVVPLFLPELGRDAAGKSLPWPVRGWADGEAFRREMKAAVASVHTGGGAAPNIYSRGVVIARNQREGEAKRLAAALAASQVPVCAVACGSPPVFSTDNRPPPRRQKGRGGSKSAAGGGGESEGAASSSVSAVGARSGSRRAVLQTLPQGLREEDKAVHVIYRLPAEAQQAASGRFDDYVDTHGGSIVETIKKVLGGNPERTDRDVSVADSSGGSGGPQAKKERAADEVEDEGDCTAAEQGRQYKWPERGWLSEQQFRLHVMASLRAYGESVVARNQTYTQGFALVHEMRGELQLDVSAVLLRPPVGLLDTARGDGQLARNTMESALRCPNGHVLDLTEGTSISPTVTCDSCGRSSLGATDNFAAACRGCDFDLCETCVCCGHGHKDSALEEDELLHVGSFDSDDSDDGEGDDSEGRVDNSLSVVDAAVRAEKRKKRTAATAAAGSIATGGSAAKAFEPILLPVLYEALIPPLHAPLPSAVMTEAVEPPVLRRAYPVQSAGCSNSAGSRQPVALPGMPDLSGLPPQVANSLQSALAQAHAVGDVEAIGQLYNLLLQSLGQHGNVKPATDDGAVAALPRIVFDKTKAAAMSSAPKNVPISNTTQEDSAPAAAAGGATASPAHQFNEDMAAMEMCAICREDFQTGQVVTRLPCGHCFHMGLTEEEEKAAQQEKERQHPQEREVEEEEEDLCPGIATWLRKSHECPMCRAPLPKKGAKDGADGTHWTCPGCRVEIENSIDSCSACGIRRNVTLQLRGNARRLAEAVEALFVDCVSYAAAHSNHGSSSVSSSAAGAGTALLTTSMSAEAGDGGGDKKMRKLQRRILQLVHSRDMDRLAAANWHIRDPVNHLLTCALLGQLSLPFVSNSWLDNNSLAVYALLVDRSQARLDALVATGQQGEDSAGISAVTAVAVPATTIHRPTFTPGSNSAVSISNSTCSLCDTTFPAENQLPSSACDCCGASFNAVLLARRPHIIPFFREAESLVVQHLQLPLGGPEEAAVATMKLLAGRCVTFLNSPRMTQLERDNWKIQKPFAALFQTLAKQYGKARKAVAAGAGASADSSAPWETIIPFETGDADCNSRALYGHFVRRLLASLKAHGRRGPVCNVAAAGAGAAAGEGAELEEGIIAAAPTRVVAMGATEKEGKVASSSSSSSSSTQPAQCFGDILSFAEPTVMQRELETDGLGGPSGLEGDSNGETQLSEDDYAAPFSEQRFCPLRHGDNAVALLRANKKTFLRMARSIAVGAREFEWSLLSNSFLPHMERCGWKIQEPVQLMRHGLRDLQTLARGLDRGTSIVLEAVLLKVLQVEKEQRDAAGTFSVAAPVPLRRQLSVGAAARNGMTQLQCRIAPTAYSRVLKFFVKTLTYIRQDPSNLMYRRLKKGSQLMTLHILPHAEALAVLTNAGFVDGATARGVREGDPEAEVFVMHTVDMDKIARLLQVLQEEARDLGLEI